MCEHLQLLAAESCSALLFFISLFKFKRNAECSDFDLHWVIVAGSIALQDVVFCPNEFTWLCVNDCSMPTKRNTRQWLIQSSDVNRSLPHCQLRPSNHWHSQWVKVSSHLHQCRVSNMHGQFAGHQLYQYLSSSFLEDFASQNVFLSACYLAGWTNALCRVLPLRLSVELHL